jgi:dTDP-4-amino-4,6-dideoxygalactose transaminase
MEKLALFGGEPVRIKPFSKWPIVSEKLKSTLLDTMENDLWGVGSDIIIKFEKKFAQFQDAKFGLSTSSGTTALWVTLKAAGVKAGDEVIIPPYTFIATGSAILMANAVPVFVDIDQETFNLDPEQLEAAITDRTKVIMPVHIAGNPARMDRILEIAAGEGGAIVSNDEKFIEACFSYANCGRVRGGKWYQHDFLGGNFRLNSMAASLLYVQIESIEKDMNIRDRNKKKLDRALSEIEGITPLIEYDKTTRSANHLYLSRYDDKKFHGIPRIKFFEAMRAEGIYVYEGYTPLYRENLFILNEDEYPWLNRKNFKTLHLPVTERIASEQAIWMKQTHLLGDEADIRDIINAFEKVTTVMRSEPGLFN